MDLPDTRRRLGALLATLAILVTRLAHSAILLLKDAWKLVAGATCAFSQPVRLTVR